MGLRHYSLQLASLNTGVNLDAANAAGVGMFYVAKAGLAKKQSLFNKDGSVLANPVALTNGRIEFYVADTVFSVDIYGQSPNGRGFQAKGVIPSGTNEIFLNTQERLTTLVIPFDNTDTVANTETDTGFNIPANAVVQPMAGGVDVLTADAHTISVGTLSSEATGVAAGFFSALSMTNAKRVVPAATIAGGFLTANTYGTQLADYVVGTNADDRGIFNRKEYVCDGVTQSISYTTSAGTTTGAGFINIAMALPA